jgi:GNAT superfamily N-acetyltransferase
VSSQVSVRGFEPDDAAACRALWAELTEWHRSLYSDPSIGGDDPGSGFDAYLEEFGGERAWVAEEGASIVGFAGLIMRGQQAEIEPVIVAGGVRGRGIGRALVEAALRAAQAEGVQQAVVRPVARNADALAFFHGLGFTALGHIELLLDFERPAEYWRAGERLAERDFRV